MTLERKIQGTIGVLLVSVLAMGIVLFWSTRQVEHGVRAMRASVEMIRSAFMLKVLLHEFADHGDKRSLTQWEINRDRLDKILSHKETLESIDKEILQDLEHKYQSVNSLAPRIMQMRASEDAEQNDPSEKALAAALLGMMSRRLEELVGTARELEQACESFTLSRRARAQKVIVVMASLMVLIILASLHLIRKSILSPLKDLSIGAAVIGSGNFDYVIEAKSDDEVGRLARSFNTMVERLKKSYDNLTAEIAERQRAQVALEAASAYNRSLIEASLDPLVTISAEGKITDVNKATERVTGYERDELIGTDFTEYFTDPQKAKEGYQQVFRDGSVKDYELEIRHRTGELTPVMYNASLYRDESGSIVGLFAAARDITQSKLAEKALKAASTYNRSLIEASLDPLVTINAEGKITDVNAATERVTGFARAELIGSDFADYFSDPEKARDGYQQVFRDGSVKDYELEIKHRTGGLTPVMYNASLYRDESGSIVGLFAAARDITASKRAEMEREKLITELEDKNAELGRFTYSVSHDLRSPLITIRTFLGFVEEDVTKGNTENLKADLGRIDRATEKMGHLLDEILELSRIGRLSNAPCQVPMIDLAREALELLSGRIAQNGVEVCLAPDLPVLYVDRPRLLEVFQNLLENAIKFMRDQPHPKIEIGRRIDGGDTIIYVKDNGMGINPLYRDKVFGLFEKLDQNSEGTGIGLALVKRIVEVHGGRIWVESEGIGHGATFCFTIPHRNHADETGGSQDHERRNSNDFAGRG